ncbi:MAG TPA: hypothetical protein VD969_21350 [Symbiobacteriaceae bacterium]|nr:hypothetical protein [Symbiobacteriaceae bacterium]
MSKKKTPRKGGSQALWWVAGIAVIAVGVLIAVNIIGSQKDSGADASAKTDAQVHADRNVKGPATAKVKLIKYSDYL